MPRRRVRTDLDVLIDSLDALKRAERTLRELNLRNQPQTVRHPVRHARIAVTEGIAACERAFLARSEADLAATSLIVRRLTGKPPAGIMSE